MNKDLSVGHFKHKECGGVFRMIVDKNHTPLKRMCKVCEKYRDKEYFIHISHIEFKIIREGEKNEED